MQNMRYEILLKELGTIHSTIKNLDDIIFKNKNFAMAFWGGGLYLLAQHVEMAPIYKVWLIAGTAFIPIIFWCMDYQWRKHLRFAAMREKIISLFINSPQFEKWLKRKKIEHTEDDEVAGQQNVAVRFPVHDPVGWIYITGDEDIHHPRRQEVHKFKPEYSVDRAIYKCWDILFFKDAWYYFSAMIMASLIFALIYSCANALCIGIAIGHFMAIVLTLIFCIYGWYRSSKHFSNKDKMGLPQDSNKNKTQ